MKFIREVPMEKVTQTAINNLQQWGFVLVWTFESLEIWADAE